MSIKDIAAKGRYGDNHLLHVSDAELQGLNSLANKTFGHGLTTNPETGLPEAFLFAPFLAPLFSGAVGTTLGLGASSALATGLTAGVLGTAEAAARDMDDPLEQGFWTGLTAGAAQGIGNTFSGMGAEAAVADPTALQNAATQYGTDAASQQTQMLAAQDAGLNQAIASAPQPSLVPDQGMTNQFMDTTGLSPTQFNQTYGSDAFIDQTGMSLDQFNNLGATTQMPTATAEPSFMDTAIEKFTPSSDKIAGAQKAFGSQEGFKEFMDKGGQASLATGMVGIGGQASLEAEQDMRKRKEAMEAEKAADYYRSVENIKKNYAAAGRPLPTNPYGGPLFAGPGAFAQGGVVGYKGGKSVEQQAYEDETFSTYDEQVADEPWYTRVPVQVLEKMGIRDPYRLRRAMDANKEVDNRAAGGYLEGGIASLKGDGMSDSVPAKIDGSQPAALSTGEYVIPADVVSHLGNGSSDDGAVRLDEMLDRVRMARTGTEEQAPQIKPEKYLPA